MRDDPVVIVGAGLAGLACAVTLHRAGRSVQVFEASDGVGGRVRSDAVDGYTLDRGFQVLLTAYPEAHRQFDLDALDLRSFEPGALVQLGSDSSVIADPFRAPTRLIDALRSPVGSLLDKARIARMRRRVQSVHPASLLSAPDRTTLDALRDEGFSDTIIERFFRPLVGGIQLDPELGTSRRLFDVIFRMLTDGDSAVPSSGMQALPDQLAAQLPAEAVTLDAPVHRVGRTHVATDMGEHPAATVVVATEGPAAAQLLELDAVESKPVGCVYFGADTAPTDERLVILNAEPGPVLNAAVMTNVAPSYAPAGRHLIAVAMPGVIEGDLAAAARPTLRRWWGRSTDDWDELAAYRIPHGQPGQPPPFGPKQHVRLDDGLFVCGDHRDTASIQGALYSGRRCAEAVLLNS